MMSYVCVVLFYFLPYFVEEGLGNRYYETVARNFQGFRMVRCPSVKPHDRMKHHGTRKSALNIRKGVGVLPPYKTHKNWVSKAQSTQTDP